MNIDPFEIAKKALPKLKEAVGESGTFSSDMIWEHADQEVESKRRPAIPKKLVKAGLIIETGRQIRAKSEARAGSPTTEYRFVTPAITQERIKTFRLIKDIALNFLQDCTSISLLNFKTQNIITIASLFSKKFLILTGLSGSGKTKLAQALSQWITPHCDNNRGLFNYSILPVGAEWTSNEHIFGYPDGINNKRYISTSVLDLMLRAETDISRPYFLVLDEMNLSHVERYFADILSAIESDEAIPLYEGPQRYEQPDAPDGTAGVPDSRRAIPRELKLPKNLFIIGTVNVDETTYQFSPKVLDRANVIEFRMGEEDMRRFLEKPEKPKLDDLAGLGEPFGPAFVQAAQEDVALENPIKSAFAAEMNRFFATLKKHNGEFGYRTAHEAARFVHFYRILGDHPTDNLQSPDKDFDQASGEFKPAASGQTWFDAAMDAVVIQKLLPKLHGSRAKLESLLIDLALLCAWDAATHGAKLAQNDGEKKSAKSSAALLAEFEKEPGKARYPRSFEKLTRMLEKLRRDQFVSFSEA